jgi:hypothetical protein
VDPPRRGREEGRKGKKGKEGKDRQRERDRERERETERERDRERDSSKCMYFRFSTFFILLPHSSTFFNLLQSKEL